MVRMERARQGISLRATLWRGKGDFFKIPPPPQVLLKEPVQPEIEREVDARVKAVVVDCHEQMS